MTPFAVYNHLFRVFWSKCEPLVSVQVFCFLASYTVTTGLELSRFRTNSRVVRLLAKLCAVAGMVAHTLYLVNRSQKTSLPPLLSSTHDWLLVLAWIAVLLYLFLSLIDSELAIGMFLMPIVLALVCAAYLVDDSPNQLIESTAVLTQEARHGWAMLHVSLLVLGMAGGLAAIVLGMMYLVQHRRLKHKQVMTEGMSLPSLAKIARLNWWAVIMSVPTLTLGMAVGVGLGVWPSEGKTPLSFSDPVILSYGVAWLVLFGFFLWLLTTRRTPERQIASFTIWAFSFLIVSILALQIISSRASISLHASQNLSREVIS